jgi:phage shock protein PspC (stress-responsive transcriptional regulator)
VRRDIGALVGSNALSTFGDELIHERPQPGTDNQGDPYEHHHRADDAASQCAPRVDAQEERGQPRRDARGARDDPGQCAAARPEEHRDRVGRFGWESIEEGPVGWRERFVAWASGEQSQADGCRAERPHDHVPGPGPDRAHQQQEAEDDRRERRSRNRIGALHRKVSRVVGAHQQPRSSVEERTDTTGKGQHEEAAPHDVDVDRERVAEPRGHTRDDAAVVTANEAVGVEAHTEMIALHRRRADRDIPRALALASEAPSGFSPIAPKRGRDDDSNMNTTPPYTPPAPPHSPWRFQRRERGRMIAGVATGMADAFHIDVVVVRVLWVVAAVATFGVAVAAYGICWLAFPSERSDAPLSQIRRRHGDSNAGFVVGLVLLGLGALFVLGRLSRPLGHGAGVGWAVVLIAAGLAVLFLRHPDHDAVHDAPRPPAPAIPAAPEAPATAGPPATPGATGDAGASAAGIPAETSEDPTTSTAWSQQSSWPRPPWPPGPRWSRPHDPRPPRRPRRRSFLTPLTISVLLIGAGAAALLDSVDAVHLTLAAVLASGLIVVGGALVLSTWFGRGRGLIPIGVLLLLATIPASLIDVPITGGIGERQYHPVARAELRRNYELGIGHLVVDLRDAPLSGRVTTITGSLGIGELDVDVPGNVQVDVRAHAGAGATEIFGHLDDGLAHDTHRVAGIPRSGVLHLVLRVGAGSIHVRRWSAAAGAYLPS